MTNERPDDEILILTPQDCEEGYSGGLLNHYRETEHFRRHRSFMIEQSRNRLKRRHRRTPREPMRVSLLKEKLCGTGDENHGGLADTNVADLRRMTNRNVVVVVFDNVWWSGKRLGTDMLHLEPRALATFAAIALLIWLAGNAFGNTSIETGEKHLLDALRAIDHYV